MGVGEDGEGNVVDRDAGGGGGSGGSVVGVTVEDHVDFEAVDGVFETTAAEKREKLGGFAFDGSFNRSVVEEGDALRGMESAEGALEAEGLVYGFLNESLNEGFAPWIEHQLSEPAAKSADAGESDAVDLGSLAIEDLDAGFLQDIGDVGGVTGFVIVIAQDGEDRNRGVGAEILGEDLGFLDMAVVGEVAAEDENIGDF